MLSKRAPRLAAAVVAPLLSIGLDLVGNRSAAAAAEIKTTTPIKHLIVIIGENRSFDHIFGLYKPRRGQTISNLLSKGIVRADGTPGAHFSDAAQYQTSGHTRYFVGATVKTPYAHLPPPDLDGTNNLASDVHPPPFATEAAATATKPDLAPNDIHLLTTGATALATTQGPDTRVPNALTLRNGPFHLSGPQLPYDSYTGNPVHRFYQMWQQSNCDIRHATRTNPSGCTSNLYPFVATTFGESNGGGGTAMAFYNINTGDAPYLKKLADEFTISDNYHQPQMGGTHGQLIYLGMGDAIFYSDKTGAPTRPPEQFIANPNPRPGTNNRYIQDGQFGACSDPTQPGVGAIQNYLRSLPYSPKPNCAPGHYYLLNDAEPGFNADGSLNQRPKAVPPLQARTIADALAEKSISFRYYGGRYEGAVAGTPRGYCAICNPLQHVSSIMTDELKRSQYIKDVRELLTDIKGDTLPAVSYVKPDGFLDGHPKSSKLNLFEAFTKNIVERVKNNPGLFAKTAIFVTFDEGGGYYDSGFIQPLDFFGDGPRIPFIAVSPYSGGGRVVHTYADHVSILKFIERNWKIRPLTDRSRDNLPNPLSSKDNPYVPLNMPAIGDLFDVFRFPSKATKS